MANLVHRHDLLVAAARRVWPSTDSYVVAAVAWCEFQAGEPVDREALVLHTRLLGFDDRYYAGLMRLFPLVGLGDR